MDQLSKEVVFQAIVETAVDGIITINEKGIIESFNSSAEKMFGYDSSEIIGQKINLLMPPSHSENHDQYITRYLKTGEKKIIGIGRVVEAKKKDGSIFPAELAVSEVWVKGRVLFAGIIHDVTERKRIEKELQRSKDHLEEQVAKRTEELLFAKEQAEGATAQFKHINKELQVALEEKEMLVREIHHRVKNNLQIISSLFQLQSDQSVNEELKVILKESQNRVDSMALIHEKLYQSNNLAKIDFGKYLQELITDIFNSYDISGEVHLKVDIENVTLGIDSAIPCSLILNELISNSLKYAFTHSKNGVLRVELHQNEKQLSLIVSDSGIGLPENIDFYSTKSLGLRLVRILTNQLKGTVELKRDAGTTFVITFDGDNGT